MTSLQARREEQKLSMSERLNRSAERHAFGWAASRSWLTHKRERRNVQNDTFEGVRELSETLDESSKIKFDPFEQQQQQQQQLQAQFGPQCEASEAKTSSSRSNNSNQNGGKRQNCDHIAKRRKLHPNCLAMSPSWCLPANANKVIQTNCCLLALFLALISILVVSCAEGRQRISKQPAERYLVEAGGSLMLPCLVEARKGQCAWLGQGKILAPTRRYVFARDPSDNNCGIRIQNVSVVDDDGDWQCQVMAPDDPNSDPSETSLQSRYAQVTVLVAPERPQIKDLSQGLGKLQVKENEKHEVLCEIRGGNPEPQILWFLDNKPISGGQNIPQLEKQGDDEAKKSPAARLTQSKLLLNPVSRTMNEKNLTCVGVHQTRNQSASIQLDVHYKPNAKLESKEVTLVEGSPLHVQCQVDSNPPASKITWNFVNEPNASKEISVVSIQQGPFLALEQVTRSYDRVKYECVAQNSVGISQPAEVRFNVLYPPRAINVTGSGHVNVGQSQRLQCLFEGNPKPEIRWFYQDPLSRTAQSVQIDSSKLQPAAQDQQQTLLIRNVTYRNEGEYYCEARNTIHGQANSVRSSPISLDVMGEPQFLAKAPVYAKVVQGVKSDISLTFCSDPAPIKIYWQFGSIQLEIKSPSQSNSGGDQRLVPPVGQMLAGRQLQQNLANKYHVHNLQVIQRRETQFSKPPTCFEATLSLLEPELSDQRDYLLHVINGMGNASGVIRVHISSPLSPALMITSAFLFIFGLFLCSLLFLFVFKKRQHLFMNRGGSSGAGSRRAAANGTGSGAPNGNSQTANGHRNRLGRKSDLDGQQASKNYQQQVITSGNKQTNGLVMGMANGLPNGSTPNNSLEQQDQTLTNAGANSKHLVHGLMSMASSETSCNDQKQLLASNCSSERNSSVGGGSSNGVAIDVHGGGGGGSGAGHELGYSNHAQSNTSSNSTDRSTANSSPSPLNHISVDDELNLNGTYQATEPVTRGLKLSPMMLVGSGGNGQSALIYANIDYAARAGQEPGDTLRVESAALHGNEPEDGHESAYGNNDDLTLNSNRSSMSSTRALRRAQHTPQLSSPSGSVSTVQENLAAASPMTPGGNTKNSTSPMNQRASVGATIALMNSLAAAQSAAASMGSPLGQQQQQQQVGALNGAISQQMMANRVRRPGPPKPPKPSIQQRSRFYQQQRQLNQSQPIGGLVMIGDSQMGTAKMTNGANNQQRLEAETGGQNPTDDLAVEYSRLAFPARADL